MTKVQKVKVAWDVTQAQDQLTVKEPGRREGRPSTEAAHCASCLLSIGLDVWLVFVFASLSMTLDLTIGSGSTHHGSQSSWILTVTPRRRGAKFTANLNAATSTARKPKAARG